MKPHSPSLRAAILAALFLVFANFSSAQTTWTADFSGGTAVNSGYWDTNHDWQSGTPANWGAYFPGDETLHIWVYDSVSTAAPYNYQLEGPYAFFMPDPGITGDFTASVTLKGQGIGFSIEGGTSIIATYANSGFLNFEGNQLLGTDGFTWDGNSWLTLRVSREGSTFTGEYGLGEAPATFTTIGTTTDEMFAGPIQFILHAAMPNNDYPGSIFHFSDLTVTATAIPEPSTYAVFAGLGALGLAAWRKRRSRANPV